MEPTGHVAKKTKPVWTTFYATWGGGKEKKRQGGGM